MRTFWFLFLLFGAAICCAQTSVTGTVVDPNGNPYQSGTASAQLQVSAGQVSTATTPVATSSTGVFTLTLNAGNYIFTVCAPPVQIGPTANPTPKQVCFMSTPISISGASQDISAQLQAIAPILGPRFGSAVGTPFGCIQFNNNGVLGADPNFCWSKVGGSNGNGVLNISDDAKLTGQLLLTTPGPSAFQGQYWAGTSFTVGGAYNYVFGVGSDKIFHCINSDTTSCNPAGSVPIVTVANLGTVPNLQNGSLASVKDGVNLNDCVTGGGILRVLCVYNGTSWEPRGEHRSTVYVTPTNYTWSEALAAGNFPTLTGGSQATVTLVPCPGGVDTSGNSILGGPNGGYVIKLSGGGNTEAVAVTGGTCTSYAASGTVVFTPFFSYTAGAYTLASGSSGIQEAINLTCGANTVHSYNNGFCAIYIGPNSPVSGTPTAYTLYDVWGTIYFHATQALFDGYGASLACHNTIRGPCFVRGDLTNSNDYLNSTVRGVSFLTPDSTIDSSGTGNLVATTQYTNSTHTNTITTSANHNFRNGDFVTCMATDNAIYWGDIPSITVTGATTFTYIRNTRGADVASQTTPGMCILQNAAILDNATGTNWVDIQSSAYSNTGAFTNFFDFWDDENATIEHFSNSGIGMIHTANWVSSFVYSMGANNLPVSSQQLAPVIALNNSSITAQSNAGVTVTNSNGVYVNNTVVQAVGAWQFKIASTTGNFGGAYFSNIYSDAGNVLTTPWSTVGGVTGLLAGGTSTAAILSLRGPQGFDNTFPTIGTGTTKYMYYIVAKDTTASLQTFPMPVSYEAESSPGAVTVKWPRIFGSGTGAAATDTIQYDVLRVSTPSGTIQVNGFVGPYFSGCPGGSVSACGSIATAVAQCAGFVCSTSDNTNNNTTSYTFGAPNFYPSPDFWPGQVVLTYNNTNPIQTDLEQFATVTASNNGNANAIPTIVQVAGSCGGASVSNAVTKCLTTKSNLNTYAPAQGIVDMGANGAFSTMAKGVLNFGVGEFIIWPHAFITFINGSFKAWGTSGYRPAIEATDVWIGWDAKQGNETILSNTGLLANGCGPTGCDWFVNVVPNSAAGNTATNWSAQLTAAAFNTKVAQQVNDPSFGSFNSNAASACEGTFGITSLNTGSTTTDTTANCLPANAIIDAVVYRITTTITTAANFTIGDATTAARFCSTQSTLTVGTTGICFLQADQTGAPGPRQTSAAKVRVTTNVNPGAGAIRLIVYYHTWSAPTL